MIVTLIPDSQYEVASQAAGDNAATVTITGKRLSADWPLNQNANDTSGNGLNGTLPNGGTWATGGGLTLNGANQYVSASQVNLGTGAFTLSAWVQLSASVTSLTSGYAIYPILTNSLASGLGYNGFDLCIVGGGWGGLYLRVGGDGGNNVPSLGLYSGVNVCGALLNHQWHLVTATRDNFGVLRLYFDGELVASSVGGGFSVTNTNPSSKLTIGYDYLLSQYNYFNGTIADVQIYSRALEPGEIETMATLSAPTGLTATPTSPTQMNLSWTATPGTEVNGYNVFRGTTPGGRSVSPINGSTPVTGTTYSDTTASGGTTYYYTVEAVNGAGSSAASSEVSGLTFPDVPSGLDTTPVSASVINMSWNTPGGTVSGYYVYRGASAGSATTPLFGSPISSTSYSDTSASAGTTYYYAVAAENASGTGAALRRRQRPDLPGGSPRAWAQRPSRLPRSTLSWTTPGGTVTSYNVYRSTSAGNEGTVAIGSTTLTSYSDTTASAGTTYYYKVAAVNGTGTGAQSGESSALTIPAMPTGLAQRRSRLPRST